MQAAIVRSLPTSTLLGLLLGNEIADRLAQRSLADVFALSPSSPHTLRETTADYRALQIIDASKELLARALTESMQCGDCLADPAIVKDYLRLRLAGLPHEVFMVLLLDTQNRLIDGVELFRGTLNQTSVYPREIVKLALTRNAASVVLAHNHPSGVAEPSAADEILTRTLKSALALVDVRVLDHFIVAGTQAPLSFAESGLI
jgi:DNA repair protein RadC